MPVVAYRRPEPPKPLPAPKPKPEPVKIERDWLLVGPIPPQPVEIVGPVEDLTSEKIIRIICHRHGITKTALLGPGRQRHLVEARHEAFYLIRSLLGRSYPEIGRRMGRKDHTTVLHGVQRIMNRVCLVAPERLERAVALRLLYEGRP